MRILVVDDDKIFREFLKGVLGRDGDDVIATDNGRDALDILSKPDAPCLVILDWIMPGISGIDVLREVRKTKDHGELYIVVITGLSDNDSVVTALEAGADDFFTKPCRRAELLARVRAGARILDLHKEKISMIRRLQHAQKLESIGQLAAGIAHEINTPVQYIGDNTRFIKDAMTDMLSVIDAARHLSDAISDQASIHAAKAAFDTAVVEADLEFLSEQIPLAVDQALDGLRRVTDIVSAMKEFSHPGGGEFVDVDLNHTVTSVATVTRNEWKYVAELEMKLDPNLPPVPCLVGDLSQAIINLIVNAAHAIAEKHEKTGKVNKGRIEIATSADTVDRIVEIRIADSGTGIPMAVRDRIFDPFFTTKEVGKGTGQGLAIAYSVVVDRHLGRLFFETEEGEGTTFTIQVPMERAAG